MKFLGGIFHKNLCALVVYDKKCFFSPLLGILKTTSIKKHKKVNMQLLFWGSEKNSPI